jgi:proteasome accessory factor B
MAESATRVERTERLLNLVFCLLSTSRPVSRATIRDVIPGYGDAPSVVAFERMFERDKDELRSMGIPIETVLDSGGDVDGYRLADDYPLEDLTFTSAELGVLALAASVWQEATLGGPATHALRKLEAAQGGAVRQEPTDASIRMTAGDAAMLPLLAGLRERRMVTFDYRGPDSGVAGRRRVDPWGVVGRDGRWYLVGHDRDRQEPRVFRLSRIEGAVTTTAQAQSHSIPPGADIRSMVGLMSPELQARATVRVLPARAAALRRQHPVNPFVEAELEVTAPTAPQLVGLICSAGSGATVLAPADVRSDVIAALAAIRDAHRDGHGQ